MEAFCDIDETRAEAFADEFDGEQVVTDAEEIFTNESIDVVYVCTRHDTHADLSIRSVASGKHVMVEKPLALTTEECLRVGQAVEESDAKLMPAFKMRYFELIQKAKDLIPEPLMITMQMMDDPWPRDGWVNDPEQGGGNVISQGVHSTDILSYMAGSDPRTVSAVGDNYYQKTGVIDNMAAVYEFENGTTCNLVQGDANCPEHASKFFLQLFDEGRSVTLTDRFCTLRYEETDAEPEVFEGSETGFREENQAFVEALQAGEEPPITYRDGLFATMMVSQAFESIETGEPQPLSPLLENLSV
jgi:predicted dehydrogenase